MYRLLKKHICIVTLALIFSINSEANSKLSKTSLGSTRVIEFEENIAESNSGEPASYLSGQFEETPPTSEENEIHSLAALIKEQNRYIDRIDSSTVMDLPAGIASSNGSLDYTIIVKQLVVTPDSGAFLEVCMSFEIPQNGRKIAFLGKRIPFTFSGGVIGEPRIELLGDQAVPLSSNIQLILKGNGGTYVEFDCNGYKGMGLSADVEFSQNIFIPENQDGTLDNNNTLKTSFSASLLDWNNLVVEVDIPAFQVKGLKGVGFNIKHAVFDFSDIHNAPGIVFPKNYQSSYFSEYTSMDLWRGFYIQEATIKLPKEFKSKDNNTNRITFYASNLLIDEQGLSGTLGAKDILTLQSGDMDGWAFSIDNFAVNLVANQITEAGFKGMMNIPVLKENSTLDYAAVISTGGNYSFSISPHESLEMSLWAAQLELKPTSSISVSVKDEKFYPEADLVGTLSIGKNTGSEGNGEKKNNVASVAGITFEHLIVRSQKPYIELGNISFGAGDKKNNLGNFPIVINEIGLKTEENRAGISFHVIVNLMESKDEGFGASGGFIVWGERDEISNNWKYSDVEVTGLKVDVQKKDAFELHGEIIFFRNDDTYGKGFKGDVDAIFGKGIELKATALFGNVNNMRYWYADAMVNLNNGIPLFPSLSLYGFGGGAYYHMRQKGFDENAGSSIGKTRSGIVYLPTSDVSLGLKASVALGTTKKEVVNGDATFEINFSSSGGINQIGFEGNIYFITSEYTTAMSDVTGNAKELANGKDKPEKTGDADRAQIWGNIKLLYDNANGVFHGEAKVYANVAGGIVRGIGSQDLAGWAVFHFEESEWYVHIGSPSEPVGLEIARIFKTKSYFMVGHNLPGSPPPPDKVSEILGGVDLDYMRDLNSLGEGKGLAFGASLEINTGDITFLIFYARLEAGVGFDIMLKDYGEAYCEGREGKIGINGWYANGQAYAYIEGSVGIKVDLLFYKGSYEILSVGLASVLQAKGPNPFWMRGVVGGRYSILGGLVKGNCRFEFTLGEECKLVTASPLAGVDIISEITPSGGSTDVDVFNTPQAIFNMPVNKIFTIKDEEGNSRMFRIKMEYFKLLLPDKSEVPGEIVWNQDNDVAGFNSSDILPSEKEITASAQVSFEESVNGTWKVVMFKGKKVVELKESTFTSGKAPDYIPVSNIEFSYPVINQYNFYKGEYSQGYIKLKKGQPELFTAPDGFIQKGRVISSSGNEQLFNISYNNKMITYTMPTGLSNSTVYAVDLVNLPAESGQSIDRNVSTVSERLDGGQEGEASAELQTQKAEGSIKTLQEKSILTYYFRTSKYNTLNDKLDAVEISAGWLRPIRINVDELGLTLHGDELFDKMETHWTETITPVVQFEIAFTKTDWYNNIIYPLLYDNYPIISKASIDWRDVSILGVPPVKAVYIRQYPNDKMLSEDDISGTGNIGTPDAAAFVYNAAHFIDQDYYNIQTKLAAYYAQKPVENEQAKQILSGMFPGLKSGNYPIDIKYVLPGINKVTSTKRIVFNNPVSDL